ncbi:MAG TPA: carbon-nitrogen hydrolase family protein [Anaerolineae bacterium]|nr:carbon-nitrogen hydrolase family protein [Anaerolineae bacterium]
MRLCLIPLRTKLRQPAANLEHLKARLAEASPARPDLVCLPECTLTGYLYEEEDVRLYAEPVPGPVTAQMWDLARAHQVHLCFGLIEQSEAGVYDTAVLLDRTGRVTLIHRKSNERPPYAAGTSTEVADTELGRLGVLICGDLFDVAAVQRLDPRLALLLVPMSRSFSGLSPALRRWEAEERQAYLDAVRGSGCRAALVNALEEGTEDRSFGGAMVVSACGELLAESPHGTDTILIWDLEEPV